MQDKDKKQSSDSQTPRPDESHNSNDLHNNNDANNDAGNDTHPDWMADFVFEEDATAYDAQPTTDVPDWLAALGPQYLQPETLVPPAQAPDVTDENLPQPPVGVRDEHGFEWLSGMGSAPNELSNGLTNEPDDELPAMPVDELEWAPSDALDTPEESDVPDWLAALGQHGDGAPSASDTVGEENEAVDAGFEWMNDLPEDDQIEPGTMPDWLVALEPQSSTAQAASTTGSLDTSDWIAALDPTDAQSEGMAQADAVKAAWFSELEVSEVSPVQLEPEASMEMNPAVAFALTQSAISADQVTDQEADNAAETFEEPISEPVNEPVGELAETATPDWQAGMETADVQGMAESPVSEVTHEPAANAPDWLNAMVPGVDLDYAGIEDVPIERDFIDSTPHRERDGVASIEPAEKQPAGMSSIPHDFDWLNEIVEEETEKAAPIIPMTPVRDSAPSAKQPRFVFTKPPAWLRAKQATTPAAGKGSNTDWASAGNTPAADFDVPDWMK